MAEPINTVFDNAILDAQTLEKFVNGGDNENANPRLNTPYPTLQKAIKEMFENGGLPATPFKTHALMTASSLPDDSYAVVTNDADDSKNGIYKKDSGLYVYQSYNLQRLNRGLEWQGLKFNSVTYNSVTRTVSIKNYILAAYPNSLGRIRINTLAIPMTGDYDVCYLDLVKLGDVADIDSTNYTNYIFVASYNTSSSAKFQQKSGQVPLFKYDAATAKVVPCSGFVDFVNESSSLGELQFTKIATDMQVFFSQPSGNKLNIGLRRNIVSDANLGVTQSNADLWRLFQFYKCDNAGVRLTEIVNAGEIELAIQHTENTQQTGIDKDHVGGFHGDEIATHVDFYIDGVRKPADFVQSTIAGAKEIELIQHSVIYFQNTTRPLCDHIKIINFKDGIVNVKQRVDFRYESVQLDTAWVAMLPILRDSGSVKVTSASSRSDDFFKTKYNNDTTAFTQVFTPIIDGSIIKQWSPTSSISSETKIIKSPNFTDQQYSFISNSSSYNKLYVSAIGRGVSLPMLIAKSTVWDTETEYKIKC